MNAKKINAKFCLQAQQQYLSALIAWPEPTLQLLVGLSYSWV
jgi:hypothetical protein